MEFSLAILMITIFSLLCYYFLFPSRSKKSPSGLKSPPEAGGAWPFTGHLHLFDFNDPSKIPHLSFGALADKHGPVFTIRLGQRRLLVVSDWKLAKELFTTHDLTISSRPIVKASHILGYNVSMFGWTPYGTYWRDMRKFVVVQLLSNRRQEMLSHVRASETTRYIKELYNSWVSKKESTNGRLLVDMTQWFGDLNLNVILRMVAGKRFYDDGAEAEEGRRTREVMRDFFHLSGLIIPGDVFPFLGRFDIGGYEKKMKENAKELDRIVGQWLEEHKVKERSSDKPQDFMDVMLEELKGDKKLTEFDIDTAIKSSCVNLISGGTDTTSVTLVWTLAQLINHPRVLKKAQEELDTVVGKERRVQESDISKLVYLQAVAKEAFRLNAAAQLGGPRVFSEDTNLGGYHIPKGTWLMVNLWKMQRDPKVWSKDALEFKPERFLETHKNIDVMGTDFELIPFGAGRRICPGSHLAVHILHLVMANLLQAFDLWNVSDKPVDMTETAGMTNSKATPLEVLVAPRLAPHLY